MYTNIVTDEERSELYEWVKVMLHFLFKVQFLEYYKNLELLIQNYEFIDAVKAGNLDVVKKLYNDGYDVTGIDMWYQDSVLVKALNKKEHYKMVEFLFEKGADPNFQLDKPFLVQCNDIKVVKLAVDKYTADVNVCYYSSSILDEQVKHGKNNEIVNYLISKGAKRFQQISKNRIMYRRKCYSY
jgi:ankyrin repeat protein